MAIGPKTAVLLCLSAALAVIANGCSDASSQPRSLRRAMPASASLQDLLPTPEPVTAPAYQPGSRLALRPSTTLLAVPDGFASYDETAALIDEGEQSDQTWKFALDEEEIRVALGDAQVDAGIARIAEAYRSFLGTDALRGALAGALAAHPTLNAVDLAGAWDLDNLHIASISLADGLWLDTDGDGTLDTPRSAFTVQLTLPAVDVPTPAAPLPECAALLGDGTAMATLAEDSGRTWIAPADANWRWQITLVAHFIIDDQSATHGALWTSTDYLSQGERDAAAHDLGIFAGFLADPATGLPGSDLIVTVQPDPAFAAPTLHLLASLARSAGDVACLRAVDGWLAEVALLQPSLTEEQLAGGPPGEYLMQAYPPEVDAGDGIVDPGLTCLQDAQGNRVQVGGDPACATASGPLEVTQPLTAGSPALVTPYQRLAASLTMSEIAPCTSKPWSEMCTSRFGRGIKLCLGEWAIRNQVGDYWNIRWWQSAGKAAAQTAIKAGGYILRGALYVYMGEGEVLPRIYLAAAKEGTPYLADLATKSTGHKVAGYPISAAGGQFYKLLLKAYLQEGLVTKEPNVVASFAVDRVIDGLAQMAEVEAVGWQDYSSDSHCACGFQYRHPNYCD